MGIDFSPSRSAAERLYLGLGLRWVDGSLQPCYRQHRLAVPLLQRTEWTFSAMIPNMRGLADIHLDVRGGDIIVDLPGTSYTVTYHKPAVSPQLLAAYLPGPSHRAHAGGVPRKSEALGEREGS